jgi:hypothetical protein
MLEKTGLPPAPPALEVHPIFYDPADEVPTPVDFEIPDVLGATVTL